MPPTRKYQADGGPSLSDVLNVLKASDEPGEDQRTVLKAQILFWLLGATDGHAKNFSVFLHPGGGFKLTPLYDVMSAQPIYDAKTLRRNQYKLAMSVGSNRHYTVQRILPRHFEQTARRRRDTDRYNSEDLRRPCRAAAVGNRRGHCRSARRFSCDNDRIDSRWDQAQGKAGCGAQQLEQSLHWSSLSGSMPLDRFQCCAHILYLQGILAKNPQKWLFWRLFSRS